MINCELMDGRDAFLTMARERHYEFSSLRRVKFSTMSMLYELHNQGQDRFVYTCNNCKGNVETGYHCTVCEDFDLCVPCFERDGHPHKMEKLGLDLDDGSSPGGDNKQQNPQEARKMSIQRCIHSLVHACQCRDANCRLTSCQKMKRVVTHTKGCKRKTNGGCPICKQLIALCCCHAKNCPDPKCPVPFCCNIKQKLVQQQQQQRFQQAQLFKRRMAVMNTTRTQPVSVPTTPVGHNNLLVNNSSTMLPSNTVLGGAISPVNNSASSTSGLIMHNQPIGMKHGGHTPPANVLQVVKQVQEEAARQQVPHTSTYGKLNANTTLAGALQSQSMPPPQMQRNLAHLSANQGMFVFFFL